MAIRTVQIRDIGPRENNIRIKVRVCRLWQAKKYKPEEKIDGLQFILVDEMNDAIHGFMRQANCELLASSIVQGNTYGISHFFTSSSQSSYKIVPHPAQIHFTARTMIRHLPELSASIPMHRFYFVDYNHLAARLNNQILSEDVIGRIKSIQPTEDRLTSDNKIESRCDIYLQNIRKEDMQVTLWGDIARTIDVDAIKAAGAPAVAVFTSLKVNKFTRNITLSNTGPTSFFLNPDIQETQSYKEYFGEPYHAAHILSSRPKQSQSLEELQALEKKSVADLNILDPIKYKDELVYCRAQITRFVPEEKWFYLACPKCFKEMRKKPQSQLLICPDHDMQQALYRFTVTAMITDESDEASAIIRGKQAEELFNTTCDDLILKKNYKNPNVLPPEILEAQGQIKLLELKIGPSQNVIVRGIYEDVQGLTPTQYIQPSSFTPESIQSLSSTLDNIQPSSSTLDNIQPSSSTSNKVPSTKRRNIESSNKKLSPTHLNKNLKRDDMSDEDSL